MNLILLFFIVVSAGRRRHRGRPRTRVRHDRYPKQVCSIRSLFTRDQEVEKYRHLDARLPVPPVRNGTVRYVVRIFFGTDFFGTVRGTDNAVRILLVRYGYGYFGTDNPYRYGFFEPVRILVRIFKSLNYTSK